MSSDAKAQKGVAQNEVSEALRTLAADIIKVIRGKGEPLAIGFDAHAFVVALEKHRSITGAIPSRSDIRQMLRVDLEPYVHSAATEEEKAEANATQTMVGASLRLAEARLLSQEHGARTASDALYRALSGLGEKKRSLGQTRAAELLDQRRGN